MELTGYLHALAFLPLEKDQHDPIDRKLRGPQRRPGLLKKRKNVLFLSGIELIFPHCQVSAVVTIVNELCIQCSNIQKM
jgi:hypothetical protein